ncbi:Granzyme G [Zancudomyces culisetae]|uniref:Granzyme G n=1 Tax=Zancudomyces culisetae TaxID=1213189 RepID=A0A1R1PWA9_ZANCU|nr:Granzyme G [Zancudomyces culisetae]|eukprot:OMH85228.1 Granzyme G [Zancudomyces culisetae]
MRLDIFTKTTVSVFTLSVFASGVVMSTGNLPRRTKLVTRAENRYHEHYRNAVGYTVRVDVEGQRNCGGALLSDSIVLTSADCLVTPGGTAVDAKKIFVHINPGFESFSNLREYPAKKAVPHEGFNRGSYNNDIGIIILEKKVEMQLESKERKKQDEKSENEEGEGDSTKKVVYIEPSKIYRGNVKDNTGLVLKSWISTAALKKHHVSLTERSDDVEKDIGGIDLKKKEYISGTQSQSGLGATVKLNSQSTTSASAPRMYPFTRNSGKNKSGSQLLQTRDGKPTNEHKNGNGDGNEQNGSVNNGLQSTETNVNTDSKHHRNYTAGSVQLLEVEKKVTSAISCKSEDRFWKGNANKVICVENYAENFCGIETGTPVFGISTPLIKTNSKEDADVVGLFTFGNPHTGNQVDVCKDQRLSYYTNANYYTDWISHASGISESQLRSTANRYGFSIQGAKVTICVIVLSSIAGVFF